MNPVFTGQLDSYCIESTPRFLPEDGSGIVESCATHPDRNLDNWVLGLMLSGTMPLRVGDCEFTAQAGEYYLLPPGVRHYGTAETNFRLIYFSFHARCSFGDGTRLEALPVCGPLPSQIDYIALFQLLHQSSALGWLSCGGWEVQIIALLDQLRLAGRMFQPHNASTHLAKSTLEYLHAHCCGALDGTTLGRDIGYSYAYLNRLFQQSYGVTIFRYHTRLRINRAFEMLQSGHSIKEVAQATGFHDYSYFLKVFKRERGISPKRVPMYFIEQKDENSTS